MKEISYEELCLNPVTTIADTWLLITAGNKENGYNSMTASWGHIGNIWGKPSICVYIRPQRYTKKFVDSEEYFTVCVMGEKYRKELAYIGSHSGKDEDKLSKVGFRPMFLDGTTAMEDAEIVFICKKLYRAPLLEEYFADASIPEEIYPEKDFHDMYVGEILKILIKD